MKPISQQRLALLASNLPSGNAMERVQLALEIWDISGEYLEPTRPRIAEEWERLPLSGFLKRVMPTVKTEADRVRRWREFLPHLEQHEHTSARQRELEQLAPLGGTTDLPETLPEDELKRRAELTMTRHREHGVHPIIEISQLFKEGDAPKRRKRKR